MKKHFKLIGLFAGVALALTSCEINILPNAGDIVPDHEHQYGEPEITPAGCETEGWSVRKCTVEDCTSELRVRIKPTGHNPKAEIIDNVVEPTCEEKGHHDEVVYCKDCNALISRKTVEDDPLGHDYNYDPATKLATCTEEGVSYGGTCKRCGAGFATGTLPALGHDYEQKDTVKLSSGHSVVRYGCTRCDQEAYGGVVLNYTCNPDYVEFSTSELYAEHSDVYKDMYKKFYQDCMTVLSSDQDYENSSGREYCAISEYDFQSKGLTSSEAGAVLLSFTMNNPQFYFLLVSSYYTYGSRINLVMDSNYLKASKRKEAEACIEKMTLTFTEQTYGKNLSQAATAKLIHDFIIDEIDYQYDKKGQPSTASWAHNIMGMADGNKETGGVCECYAKTYMYLSYVTGLNTIIISGKSDDGSGNLGGHAWNATKIGSSWYGVDVTWDDQSSVIYDYFLASKSTMDEQHFVGSSDVKYDPRLDYFQVVVPELSETAYPLS